MSTTTTMNVIIPEVLSDLVETKLGGRMSLLPLAVQDNTLKGQPGDTLKFPAFRYIGKAEEVAENGRVTPNLLTSFAVAAMVRKYAKAVQITDEVRLSGFGDPVGEAAAQLAHAIDHAVDDALFAEMGRLPLGRLYPVAGLSAAAVADGLTLFGEDLDGEKVILVDPEGFAALRKDPDFIRASDLGQRAIFTGVMGEIWGCQILVSSRVKADAERGEKRYYIIKPGALRLVNKTGTFIEVNREAEYMRDTIYASKHCAAYLYDDSKALALSLFLGVETLDADTAGIMSLPGSAGKTRLIIPDNMTPATCKWVYTLDSSPNKALTFGTAVTGATAWVDAQTEIATGSNTYIHAILVDGQNKPQKACHLQVNAG
ncbi:MAG: hypothetical protein GXZ04_06970 [Clostridiales bacterium]|nr:hypothetical protein [Clostridiales bacterium]